jgi:acetyltransferase-like isoleucine patch superfamily enzyme
MKQFIKNPYLISRKIGRIFNSTLYRFYFKKYGKGSRIESAYFITPQFIELGNNVFICERARVEGVSNYEGFKFNPLIILQDNVTIQQNIHLTCANSIIIKKHTAIAANVTITDIIHPYEDILIPIEKQPIIFKKVEIGEECKIYNNAVILPGVILGKHCVVGANSVVKEGVYPDYSILAGSPAKIVRQYIDNKWEKVL